ncbi:hypothetical protein E4U42_004315 [Claviceps africana]|uniref:Glycosyl hydrolase family 30 TIM-barrel domain-containing protein n=1 Tax=Claviceps africana TaxID=83212 RepID=A0A8K0JBH5_9HYPO|nr:hypothetical protein E4U42_004315 [Claviceps africana]
MDGIGVSEAFQAALTMQGHGGLSPKNQAYVLDLLFSLDKGAGFTILRNGLGTSDNTLYSRMSTIEPVSPGSPDAKPKYVWDGNSTGQVQLSLDAQKRGIEHVYLNAWSAPSFMKTSGDDIGGSLCGVMDSTCASGNWVNAYVDFLVQYVKFYEQSGVKVTELGFLNEPEIKTTYVSMFSTGRQASEVLRVLGPALKQAGLDVKLTCCDAVGWHSQQVKMGGLQGGSDPGESHLDVITAHGYGSAPLYPLNTKRKVWQTEWSDLSQDYTPSTFFEKGLMGEGMTWASNIIDSYTKGNVNGFLYWIGASAGQQV